MVDEHLQRSTGTGHLLKHPDTGHLAKKCIDAITCDCEGHGPITVTVTTSGSCDEGSTDCGYDCAGDVFSAVWVAGSWIGGSSIPGPSTGWTIEIACDDSGGDPVWTMTLEGGCGDDTFTEAAKWTNKVFIPTGCVEDGEDGYPTVAGVNLGNPTTNGACWIDCVPTVALS